jgi:hypothetical protein
MRKLLVALLLVIVAVVLGGYAALKYATDVPGQSHQGPLPRLSSEERAIAATLKLGYYSDAPGSQQYPVPFGMMFPNVGNFVAFVGLTNSRPLVHQTMQSFRSHTAFPTVGGVAPVIVSGIGWSDHWSFGQYGFQGSW